MPAETCRTSRTTKRGHRTASSRVPATCLTVFLIVWAGLAVSPLDRPTWALESLPIAVSLPVLFFSAKRFRFSDRAYIQGTAFLILHAVGSHYTYSQVPLGEWLASGFHWSRNHYDRIVHGAFGLLILRPFVELVARNERLGRVATAWTGIASIACGSVVYEVLEWLTAIVVDPNAGTAFLGTQGDEWDAQKDLAMALAGAAIAVAELNACVPASSSARLHGRSRPRCSRRWLSWYRRRRPDSPVAHKGDSHRGAG